MRCLEKYSSLFVVPRVPASVRVPGAALEPGPRARHARPLPRRHPPLPRPGRRLHPLHGPREGGGGQWLEFLNFIDM